MFFSRTSWGKTELTIPINHKLSVFSTIEITELYINDVFAGQPYHKNCVSPLWMLVRKEDSIPDMTNTGWCPYDALQLMQKSPILQIALYLKELDKRQNMLQGHRHQTCDPLECRKNLLSSGANHRTLECNCSEFQIDVLQQKDISAILNENNVPLLSLNKINNVVNAKVIPRSVESKYAALSHVCADGLGNEQANALSQCQLSHVYDKLMAVRTSLENHNEECLVWIDTLCVPKEDEMRKKAITLMRNTYAKAEIVLVLDAELEMTDHRDMDFIELLARIICSGWMRRLWTLQEGFLAQTLWIQFREEAVNIDKMMQEQNEKLFKVSEKNLYNFLKSSYFGIRTGQAVKRPDTQFSIRSLAMTVPGRLTKNYEDEPTCLSTLLGLPLESLFSVPKEERMVQFWQLLSESTTRIPDYIIFGECPRLSQQGFRWAPSSLLKSKIMEVAISQESRGVKICSMGDGFQGLHTELPGIQLSPIFQYRKPTALTMPLWMRLTDGKCYFFGEFLAPELPLDGSQYAIIFSRTPRASQNPAHALLVKVHQTQDNVKFVSRIRPILIPMLYERIDRNRSILFEAVFQYLTNLGHKVETEEAVADAANQILGRDPSLQTCLQAMGILQQQHAAQITEMVTNLLGARFVVMGERLSDTQQWILN